ncbi:hypothetical protein MLD38_040076 [Melastoma candidum]|uniref:Uncharacterized protein n=1 Tax=Melastoma candidum TaxID=119954 RepID=A0ACB9L5J9_9MYRT|nr:hypothetical protein MLD38_040076 [Melastoma candidum]
MAEAPKSPSPRPHVLIVPYPAQGHINPMLQFSKRLAARGIRATLATTIYLAKSMHVDPTAPVDVETISDGYDEGGYGQAKTPDDYQKSLETVGSRTLAALIERLEESDRPVHAVIYDGFIPWALDVTRRYSKVGVVFFTQTCAVNNIYYHVQRGLLGLPLEGPVVSVPGLPPLRPSETPSYVYKLGSYPAFYDMVINQFINVDEADIVLFSTFYELEKEVVDWMSASLWPLKTIGPTLPSAYLDKRLDGDSDYAINLFESTADVCSSWLNSKPHGSVIYVSFGSMARLPHLQVTELSNALVRSARPFLWVVRSDEQHKLPGHLSTATDRGLWLIVPWCNQLEVLSHRSVGCFVTHCGLNSVIEAICLGVPMVAVPQWTDQTTNAKYIEDVWRVGVRTRMSIGEDGSEIVRSDALEECLREVMEGERAKEMKENALKWKEKARAALDDGGSSDQNIEAFVGQLLRMINTIE